jgi:hypothetical protein
MTATVIVANVEDDSKLISQYRDPEPLAIAVSLIAYRWRLFLQLYTVAGCPLKVGDGTTAPEAMERNQRPLR